MKKLTFLLLASVAGFACGGDSSDASSPKGKCYALASAYCDKVIGCGRFAGSQDSCVAMFAKLVYCEKASSVSTKYDDCLSTMNGASCDKVTLTPPSICNGVVVYTKD